MMRGACIAAIFWAGLILQEGWAEEQSSGQGQGKPAASFVYKKTATRDLVLYVDYPADWNAEDRRPCIVFFYGGGWTGGDPKQFEPQAGYFAQRGAVCVRPEYRIRGKDGVLPDKCVEDALSAMSWVRARADSLGIDPERIVAAGGSAGGHLACCTFFSDPLPGSEALNASPKPDAMILYNPALDLLADDARLKNRVGDLDEETLLNISPTRRLRKDMPPTLLIDGTQDFLYGQIKEFYDKGKALESPVEVFWAEDQAHGFFNKSPWLEKTTLRADEFLKSIGFLKETPKVDPPVRAKFPENP